MFDESGWDIRQPVIPKTQSEIPTAPQAIPVPLPQLANMQRPLWLYVTIFLLCLGLVSRFCTLPNAQNSAGFMVQFAITVVMGIIILGLWGMRRWAAWLLIFFCGWSVIHVWVVAVARIVTANEQISNIGMREQLILNEVFMGFLILFLYGVMGVWYAFHLKRFIPTRSSRYGNLPYALMVSIMILFTATQIADAPRYLRVQEDAIEDSQDMVRDLLGQ
jgi:hypothetical protein